MRYIRLFYPFPDAFWGFRTAADVSFILMSRCASGVSGLLARAAVSRVFVGHVGRSAATLLLNLK